MVLLDWMLDCSMETRVAGIDKAVANACATALCAAGVKAATGFKTPSNVNVALCWTVGGGVCAEPAEHCGVPDGFHEHPPTRVQCVWSVQLGQFDATQLASQLPPLLSA